MRYITVILLAFVISGCSGMKISDYAQNEPAFDLFEYFEGDTRAWGIFQSRSGELKRQFTVDIRGTIKGKELTLVEDFLYADGEVSQRVWIIESLGDGAYRGRAEDVVGAAEGVSAGNALNWQYELELPYKNSLVKVRFDDWMYLQPDNVLINKASVSKFGLKVGEVTLVFRK
ncbi:MAG: DUF3833 domain-containing protein [bacterium]